MYCLRRETEKCEQLVHVATQRHQSQQWAVGGGGQWSDLSLSDRSTSVTCPHDTGTPSPVQSSPSDGSTTNFTLRYQLFEPSFQWRNSWQRRSIFNSNKQKWNMSYGHETLAQLSALKLPLEWSIQRWSVSAAFSPHHQSNQYMCNNWLRLQRNVIIIIIYWVRSTQKHRQWTHKDTSMKWVWSNTQ